MSRERIRVLIVEDSATVRALLEHIVDGDPRFEVVASVASAEAALELLPRAKPDVISMDVYLPRKNGLEATREIMHTRPTPTVVVSAAARADEVRLTMRALQAGALGVVEKPPAPGHPGHARAAAHLLGQLAIMSRVKVIRQRRFAAPPRRRPPPRAPAAAPRGGYAAVGIVASTGGPKALEIVLAGLRPDFPLPILLVQHIGNSFLDGFVQWLGGLGPLPACKAYDRTTPRPGTIHVAPEDRHLVVAGGLLRVRDEAPVCFQRPSGTILLESMARDYGDRAVGVVLTGMGEDGAQGLLAIRERGGHTIAEDPSTAVVYGMPGAAVARAAVREQLPVDAIGPRLSGLAMRAPVGGEA